ncbi:hypothetical protein M9H77_29134 [Catharanthus roseus]|uniref:Uncharacterized protein n=1 Tax=Catharanthus roseus TaxID=4058 RepID=A0ACC0AHZ0_CATRO|nr:hypothetical protein M9H77_29134 [Catharanthus roseus]
MPLICKQSSKLITTLKHKCKTIKQVYQIHAQAITRGLFSLQKTFHIQILHTFTSLLTTSPPLPNSPSLLHYVTTIFNLIPNPSTFCYNTIIRAHTLLCSPHTALIYFSKMGKLSIPPDTHTFSFALKACAHLNSFSLAKTLHCKALKFGFIADLFVCNSLIHLYSVAGDISNAHVLFDELPHRDMVSYNVMIDGFVKAAEIVKARELFERMPERNVVSWGTLMGGYAKAGQFREAIELFDQMFVLKIKPDNVALVAALSACSHLGDLEKGRRIHDYILQHDIRIDVYLTTGLVDMYAKCGCIETAREIFELSRYKNLCTWNAMLVGLAMHGYGKLLLDYFSRMVADGVRPDGLTFLGVLVGCSHAGLIKEGRRLFEEMEDLYGVQRELKHYGSMADLLGRAGLIEEAIKMIEAMPMIPGASVWGGLLGGCRMHGNIEIAEKAAKQLMAIKPKDDGVYSMLANVYATAEQWEDLVKIRRLRDCKKEVERTAGCSLIQLNGKTHEFVAGDDLHPLTKDIYFVTNTMAQHQLEPTAPL